MGNMTRRIVLATVVLGTVASLAGRADAEQILTYTFTGTFDFSSVTVTGSFTLDSKFINPTGTTVIDADITGLSFTTEGETFSPAIGFGGNDITVLSNGDLTSSNGEGRFQGSDTTRTSNLTVGAQGATMQEISLSPLDDSTEINGTGSWTHTALQPSVVPEPSSIVLALSTFPVGIVAWLRRRRRRA